MTRRPKNVGTRAGSVAAVVCLSALAACDMEPGGWVAESGDIASQGGAASVFDPNADALGTTGPGEGEVGAPCGANEECVTEYCMTTREIGGFIAGAEVAGGYCSTLFCALDGSDGACTAEMGGVCFSLFAFLGAEFAEMGGICLRPCNDDRDCRVADGNVCFDAAGLVAEGLLSRDVLDLYYGEHARGCIPETVVEAAVAKLRGQ